MKKQKYCLVSDDDGHWYIVPKEKRLSFSVMLNHEEIPDFYAFSWIRPVDGPECIVFEEWEEV